MTSPNQRPVLTITYAQTMTAKDWAERERRDALEMEIHSLKSQASEAEDEGDWDAADAMTEKAAVLQTQLDGMQAGAS